MFGRQMSADSEEQSLLAVRKSAFGTVGDSERSGGTTVDQHGYDDGAFETCSFRAGTNVAGGVCLDVARRHGLGAFDGEAGHSLSYGDSADSLKNELRDAGAGGF